MPIKIKAKERLVRFDPSKQGEYRYIMQPEVYGAVEEKTVMTQVAQRSGLPEYAISAVFNALAEVMTTWATNGHSVPVPGLGTMRFGVRARSVADVLDVDTSLIRSRRVIFTPSSALKLAFKSTSINITCYDRDGQIRKRVDSKDDGTVEDGDDGNTPSGGTDPGSGGSSGGDDNFDE